MYDVLFPKKVTPLELLFQKFVNQTKGILWTLLMLSLCLIAIPMTSDYFMGLYQVSPSIRASIPSFALFEIFNIAFWLIVFVFLDS
jgi:hypothetical protein